MNAIVPIQSDDRQQMIQAVLDAMQSPNSKRAYERALTDFLT